MRNAAGMPLLFMHDVTKTISRLLGEGLIIEIGIKPQRDLYTVPEFEGG